MFPSLIGPVGFGRTRLEEKFSPDRMRCTFPIFIEVAVQDFWDALQSNKQSNDRQTFTFLMLIFWFEWLENRKSSVTLLGDLGYNYRSFVVEHKVHRSPYLGLTFVQK